MNCEMSQCGIQKKSDMICVNPSNVHSHLKDDIVFCSDTRLISSYYPDANSVIPDHTWMCGFPNIPGISNGQICVKNFKPGKTNVMRHLNIVVPDWSCLDF